MPSHTPPLLALLLALVGCASPHVHRLPWVEARTPNFVLLTPMARDDAARLARELELFRSVVEVATGQAIPPSPIPVRVFVLDQGFVHRPFAVPGAAGYFASSMRESTIVVGDFHGYGVTTRDILQHEYVHFLLRNRGRFAYPPWYDEGMAEFLSTVERKQDRVEIGRVARHRIPPVGTWSWLPIETLLATRTFEELSAQQCSGFYAESWAFVHYLYLGRRDAKGRKELTAYLNALRQGMENEDAVVAAFGASSRALGHQVRKYVKAGTYTFLKAELSSFDPGAEPSVRPLHEGEVAHALGELSLSLERYAQAEGYFAAALAARPGAARSLAGLGRSLAGEERAEEASARFDAALAAAPDDAVVQLDYGNHLHGRARATEDADARSQLAASARRHYVRSWKLDDGIPETYAQYGATYLLDGEDPARGLETLEHAHRLLPSSPEIALHLARLYAKLGRDREARDLALRVSTWSHSRELAGEVREILEATGPAGAPEAAPAGD